MTAQQDVKLGLNIAYQATGVYTTAMTMAEQYLFEQAAEYAIVELGLTGTAVAQYANQAAAVALPTSGVVSTISSYLPYIGAGLAIYDAVTGKIHGGDQALLAASAIATAFVPALWPAMAFFAVPMMLSRPDIDNHVYVHNPELEVVHIDEEGNYYLYDTSTQEEKGKIFTDSMNHVDDHGNVGRGSLIKFNPETNKITRGHIGYGINTKPLGGGSNRHGQQLTLEQTKELFTTGQCTITYENYEKSRKSSLSSPRQETGYYSKTETLYLNPETDKEYSARIDAWKTSDKNFDYLKPVRRKDGFIHWHAPDSFNPELKFMGGRGASGMYNVRALQAELYNKVLLPNNLVPPTQWESITVGGIDYLVDPSGAVADAGGMIVGGMDLETGQISSLQSLGRLKYNSHGQIQGGQDNPVMGIVDQMPPADFFTASTVSDIDRQDNIGEQENDEPWPKDPTLWEEEPNEELIDNRIRIGPGMNELVSSELRNRIILGQGFGRQITPYQLLKQTAEQPQEINDMALPPFLQKQISGPGGRPGNIQNRLGRPQLVGGSPLMTSGNRQGPVPGIPGGESPVALGSGGGPGTLQAPGGSGLDALLGGKGRPGGNKSSLETVLGILRQLVNSGQLR